MRAVPHSYLESQTIVQSFQQLKILQPGNISVSSLMKYDSADLQLHF